MLRHVGTSLRGSLNSSLRRVRFCAPAMETSRKAAVANSEMPIRSYFSGFAETSTLLAPASPRHQRGRRGDAPPSTNEPTKDRMPPPSYDAVNPRRRLAVLVDASSISVDTYIKTVEPAVNKVGVPILIRVFSQDLSPEWRQLLRLDDGQSQSSAPTHTPARVPGCAPTPMEYFRVEKFIPLWMQIEADANHILEYKAQNKLESICYVAAEVEKGLVEETIVPRFAGGGVNQYILDELGMAKEYLEDGRSVDGV